MISHENTHVSRPVRRPSEKEARLVLARDLCRKPYIDGGYDREKFARVLQLPLFQVALGGMPAMHEVYEQATALARRVA